MSRRFVQQIGGIVVAGGMLGLFGCGGSVGGTGGDGGGGAGGPCGGAAGLKCADDEYCDYPLNNCGANDAVGECKPKPEACDKVYAPVCTCQGTVAGNDCAAYVSGSDLSSTGGCAAPAGMFACGAGFCDLATQYCQRTTSDVGGEPDSYGCQPLPAACASGTASCDCLAAENCGSLCSESGGGFTLTCPGG